MSSRRSVTRATAPLKGRAARASSRDVKKDRKPVSAASKRRQEGAIPVRKAASGKNKRKRGDDDSDSDDDEQQEKGGATKAKVARVQSESPAGGRKPSVIDPKEDEQLMRAVVSQEKKLRDSRTKKMPVWDAIAKACGGRFTTGHTAFGKVKWLQRVVRDKRHPQYEFLSPALVKLLKQYIQFSEGPQRDAGSDDEHVTMKEVVEEEKAEEADAKPKGAKARRGNETNAADEEELMAIVLKHATRFAAAENKLRVWDSIARESQGRFDSGGAASRHYDQLVHWLDPTHYMHSMLTPILHVQLQELKDSGYDGSRAKKAIAAVDAKKDVAVPTPPPTAAAVAVAVAPTAKPALKGKEPRGPPSRLPTPHEDDWLLYEILRVRPFDHKGESNPYWETIAASLHQRLGSTEAFPDRTACQKRMSKLMNAIRRPNHPTTPVVTSLQLEVLQVILSVLELKYQWASMIKDKTPFYLSVNGQIETLREQIKPKLGSSLKPTLVAASQPTLGELPQLPAEPEVHVDVADDETKDSEPPHAAPPPQTSGSQTALPRDVQVTKQLLSSNKVQSLTSRASKLERERRDHARAFATMLQVLQDEQDKLQRDGDSVLAKVERQRADRKDEFKTMINLVAHAAAQYRA